MLGNVVEKKMRKGRRKKSQGHNNSASKNVMNSSQNNNGALNKQRQFQQQQSPMNKKITDFFPIRRSNRRTAKEIEILKMKHINALIDNGVNEDYLEVFKCPIKGRSIRPLKTFQKGEFVVEYKGDIITAKKAQVREEYYSNNENVGSYMYYFKHRGNDYCVDATEETPWKGRLINHSCLRPNLKTRVVDFGDSFHLILVAKRDIDIGEELLYDYGERRPEVVAKNPWLLHS